MRGPGAWVRGTRHPEAYHGRGVRSGYFEGWYVKLVSAERDRRLAVIPGIFRGRESAADEAFVQVLDGATGRSWFCSYPPSEFWAAEDRLDIRVGPNRFTDRGVDLDLPDGLLSGSVRFTDPLDPWPVTPLSPGIMGWYAWVPTMECYHGVVSFGHGLAGTLTFEGRSGDFDGGRGYMEKDWGQAFPAGYVWMHSNHLADAPRACLIASVAIIPWRRSSFRGFIVGLRLEDRLLRWATYNRSREELLEIDDDEVRWRLIGPDGRLSLRADRVRGGLLHAPVRTQMHKRVEETMDATVHVRLEAPDGSVLLETLADCAGLEVFGDLDRLLSVGTR